MSKAYTCTCTVHVGYLCQKLQFQECLKHILYILVLCQRVAISRAEIKHVLLMRVVLYMKEPLTHTCTWVLHMTWEYNVLSKFWLKSTCTTIVHVVSNSKAFISLLQSVFVIVFGLSCVMKHSVPHPSSFYLHLLRKWPCMCK